jgi:hypothetical protein
MMTSVRAIRAVTACLAVVAVSISGLVPAVGASLASPTSPRATADLSTVLAQLPVVPQIDNGYAYAKFAVPAVNSTDSRGCGKRERVLLASATTKPRVAAGCKLVGGTWSVDAGTKMVRGSGAIDVVPLVSSKTVWNQGGFGWSNAQRRAFLLWYQKAPQECAVGAGGSGGASGAGCAYVLQTRAGLTAQVTDLTTEPKWRPTCGEIAGVTSILASWGLSVEPSAATKMQGKVGSCSGKVTVTRLNRTNPLPPTEAGNPFSAAGTAAGPRATTDVLNAAAGPPVPAALFGLHVPDVTGAAPQLQYEWLRLWDAKTGWEPLEQSRGTYYWKWIDDAVAYAEANGKKVIYVFGDTPGWAGPSASYPPTSLAEYRRYVQAVVSRYGNRIAAYEVWNEPNLFVPVSETLADLVDMTQAVYDIVKGGGLSSLVLTPSTTMRTGTAVYPFFSEYLVKLAARGWPVDGYTFHTYPRAAGGPEQRVQAIALFKALLVLAKAPVKPIWDTEINYGLGGLQEPQRDITGADAQGYLAQTFIDAVRYGVTQVDWYLWFSQYYKLLGIQTNPGTPETNHAWQWTHDQLVGSSLHACGGSGPAVVCGFSKGGTPFALAYSSSGAAVSVKVPSNLTTQCDIDGRCTPITGGAVTVGIRPVKLT